jgi:signal transduction histidine kinase
MLSNLLLAIVIAVTLFLVSNILLDKYVENVYLSDEKKSERTDNLRAELEAYIDGKGITYVDINRVSGWAKEHKYLYMLIYRYDSDKLLYETGRDAKYISEIGENKENADDSTENSVGNSSSTQGANTQEDEDEYLSEGVTVRVPTRDELFEEAINSEAYVIDIADGRLRVFMVDYSEYLCYDIFNVISILLAFAGFLTIMWIYFFDITKRIARLGREVTAIADGDVNYPITAAGDDEITRLCSDVEYMRISMLENLEKEHAALESNRELITAMSHDIRTPLTVLLGYLDIMKSNAVDSDMQQYIDASERTALRLKKMSDDMFGYFLVYGGGIEVEIDECDARTLVDQMLSGHVFLLREQGYNIEFNFEEEANDFLENVIVVSDPPQLMRIVENLFSNVLKYADKGKPVTVYVNSDVDEMTIKVSNFVASTHDEAQKNGIGLRSCMKLANAMDIRLSTEEEDGVFTSLMYIPIIPDIDYSMVETTEESEGIPAWLESILKKYKNFMTKLVTKIKNFVSRKK